MRIPGRCLLAVLFVAALQYPGTTQAKEPVHKSWAKFLSEAEAYATKEQNSATRKYDLYSWKRFYVDPKTRTLTFSTGDKPGVVAHVLFVGSVANKPGTWLWSWADSSAPKSMSEPILRVRKFGEDHGFKKLTEPSWPGDKTDGWDMTAAAAFILSAKGVYRAPYEDGSGYVFLVFTDIHRVK